MEFIYFINSRQTKILRNFFRLLKNFSKKAVPNPTMNKTFLY